MRGEESPKITEIKKEGFIQILESDFDKRLLILNCKKDSNYYMFKILLLLIGMINIIATNIFFFSEKNIHQIYIDKGKYNFGYQIKFIIFSSLISYVLLYFPKNIINFNNKGKMYKIILYNFFFISLVLFVFYWLYIGAITSTYINAKKHILANSIIALLFCYIVDCLFALISSILEYKSFTTCRKIIKHL